MRSSANRPTEHKTVQARILKYAQEIGWRFNTQPEVDHEE